MSDTKPAAAAADTEPKTSVSKASKVNAKSATTTEVPKSAKKAEESKSPKKSEVTKSAKKAEESKSPKKSEVTKSAKKSEDSKSLKKAEVSKNPKKSEDAKGLKKSDDSKTSKKKSDDAKSPKESKPKSSSSSKKASNSIFKSRGPLSSSSIPNLRSTLRLPRLRPASACNGATSARSAASSPSGPPTSTISTHRFAVTKSIPIPVPDQPTRQRLHTVSFEDSCEGADSSSPAALSYNSGVFSAHRSPRRREFVIHPEWASEAVHGGEDQLPPLCHPFCPERPRSTGENGSLWPKRCKSAPPPLHRNPITWN